MDVKPLDKADWQVAVSGDGALLLVSLHYSEGSDGARYRHWFPFPMPAGFSPSDFDGMANERGA